MGEHNIDQLDEMMAHSFMKALLEDLRALAFMLADGRIQSGVWRIGAEQEMFLIDHELRPAPHSLEVIEAAGDARLTTEIAKFNLEANLTPLDLSGDCFSRMENELTELITLVRSHARIHNADVLLAGILPTLRKSDLTLKNLTPIARYHQLNRGVIGLRGGPISIHIKGLDELQLTHDNIMMESCNTSFQIHFQSNPGEFVNHYNVAQVITAPVLAVAVNSPLLFGHRLWQETRVALFQHSTDERSRSQLGRSQPTRVSFGDDWLRNSVIELFNEQISRFRPIMFTQPDENPFQVLARGEIPRLSALRLHNGTVWRWNRACYGITEGIPHLRIENRALPAGPTIVDEIANATFFTGLMLALPNEYPDISEQMKFEEVKSNFFRAARDGLDAQFEWFDGESHSASSLILERLLPLARKGLRAAAIAEADVEKYLGIIESRARTRQTGARWLLKTLTSVSDSHAKELPSGRLTAAMLAGQSTGSPIHTWAITDGSALGNWEQGYQTVGQFMSTDLFTVRPDDLIDLAASLMDWRHIRHVPVENAEGQLVGLVTHRALLRLISSADQPHPHPMTVQEIMITNPLTVSPSTSSLEAIETMQRQRVGCLPVVEESRLVGIVTSYDFLAASASLFKQHLNIAPDKTESEKA
jgi:CBS domain-containing protein/gamma-glutamyl:cysteine ligase YbdK (ATP-grasp superfamily)